jgi:hypothetical protein
MDTANSERFKPEGRAEPFELVATVRLTVVGYPSVTVIVTTFDEAVAPTASVA